VDGVYYGRVTYAAACQRCHALQIDPANPDLLLPHGDVGRVRTFLHSLVYQYSELYRQRQAASGVAVSPADAKTFATTQVLSLVQKTNVRSPDELDHRILFTSDPYKDSPPTNERPFFSGCAYCHQVTQPAGGGDPVITPPRMAERWLAHGAFTHAKHVSMSCVSCHDANNSRQATDVIMPPKESCVSCHRTNGVAPSNCLACHGFHSPQSVTKTVKAQWNLSQLALAQGVAPLNNFLTPDQSVKQKDKP
jgi:predicted CXXCH cytochrome family protein